MSIQASLEHYRDILEPENREVVDQFNAMSVDDRLEYLMHFMRHLTVTMMRVAEMLNIDDEIDTGEFQSN